MSYIGVVSTNYAEIQYLFFERSVLLRSPDIIKSVRVGIDHRGLKVPDHEAVPSPSPPESPGKLFPMPVLADHSQRPVFKCSIQAPKQTTYTKGRRISGTALNCYDPVPRSQNSQSHAGQPL